MLYQRILHRLFNIVSDSCIPEVLERVSLSRADIQYLERNTSYNEKEIKEWFRSGKSCMDDY